MKVEKELKQVTINKHIERLRKIIKLALAEGFLERDPFLLFKPKLPKLEKQKIPLLNFNDSHINTMAKDYYQDQNFCRKEDGRINLWDVFNLFTQANKSSYIDTFLDRNLNAFEFTKGIQKTLNGNSDYHWFLS